MNSGLKTAVFWIVILISATLLFQVVRSAPGDRSPEISYSRFMSDVEAGNVASVTITGTQIQGLYRENKGSFRVTGPSSPAVFLDTLRSKGVEIRFRDAQTHSGPPQLLSTWAPLILLGALWFFLIRRMQRKKPGPRGTASPIDGDLSGFGTPK